MAKRKKFVLVSFLLTLGLIGLQFIPLDRRYEAVVFFSGLSVLLSIWSLLTDLKGVGWLTAMILPALYPASVGLFYFLLPQHLFSQVLLLILFGIGMYALLLTENIYSVAAIRTIQLIRAAHAVGLLLTITTGIFLTGTMFGLKLPFWVNGLTTMAILFPLMLQGLWSTTLEQRLQKRIIVYAGVFALIGGELAGYISLLPMTPLVAAILINGYLYVILGLLQQYLEERLFVRTIREYVFVSLIVLAAAILVTYR